MKWNEFNDASQFAGLQELSKTKPVLIFKHSTRCSISSTAKNRLERNWDDNLPVEPVYLDLISYRDISNGIAEKYQVIHESPQILLIKDGKCIYNASHMEIDVEEIKKHL